jgi:hypothetical protein
VHRSWLMISAVALALAASACGDDDEVVDSVDSSTSEPTVGNTVQSSGDGESWDLLYISDSSGWKTGEAYARLAEEELGIPVRLLPWRVPSRPLVQAKQMIADNPEMVAEAEIVVLGGNPLDSGTREEGVFACWPAEPVQEFAPYTTEDWVPYADLLESTFDDVRTARQGQPTVLRAVDIYVPVVANWASPTSARRSRSHSRPRSVPALRRPGRQWCRCTTLSTGPLTTRTRWLPDTSLRTAFI